MRGTTSEEYATLWDWYATFCAFAGVDAADRRAAAAGLPPIDSHDLSALVMGTNTTSPRTEIPLGTPVTASDIPHDLEAVGSLNGLIQGDWKLIQGKDAKNMHQSGWQGPHYPNISDTHCFDTSGHGTSSTCVKNCESGCLFNIKQDPTEHHDLASENPERVAAMTARLEALRKTAFNPNRGKTDPEACAKAMGDYRGFWGPWVFP